MVENKTNIDNQLSKHMRVLVLRSCKHIFEKTDYQSYRSVQGDNTGNDLWLMGLISTISGTNCTVEYQDRHMDPEYINQNYDMCIKPEANMFSEKFAHYMDYHVKQYSKISIPIHVIAVGAQAKNYDELDDLAERIKPSAERFIESIDRTGGLFALRGRFTEALFKKLGYHKAYVTGCPSLFQLGPLNISKQQDVDRNMLLTAFNGNLHLAYSLIKKNKGVYFDQSIFFDTLYGETKCTDYSKMLSKYGLYGTRLLMDKKVQLFLDMPDWMYYLKSNGFNFSIGTRIHGNIMPILSGIPALVVPPDARVREMCDFFDIPTISYKKAIKGDLYDLYNQTDYSMFNTNFQKKLDYYINFLKKIGIEYNPNSLFFTDVIHDDYSLPLGYEDYKANMDIVRVKKKNELYYQMKELGKSLMGFNHL